MPKTRTKVIMKPIAVDWTLVKSKKAWRRWLRKNYYNPDQHGEPEQYPCLAFEYIGGDEDGYPSYIYPEHVVAMAKALGISVDRITTRSEDNHA